MQKALLMASVIIGAFLFQPNANSQVLTEDGNLGEQNPDMCPLGGGYAPALSICFVPATEASSCKITHLNGRNYAGDVISGNTIASYKSNLASHNRSASYPSCVTTGGQSSATSRSYTTNFDFTCDEAPPGATSFTKDYTVTMNTVSYTTTKQSNGTCSYSTSESSASKTFQMTIQLESTSAYQCPPESSNPSFQVFNLGPLVTDEGYNICFYPSSDPGNDGDDCPEGTIGGCEPPEPDCIIAGNGMEVCKEDPNEKCESTEQNGQTVYFNCEAGCGFVNDQFLCTTEPDSDGEIPDLSKCFKVGNSWACPSDPTTPDDNIQNPEKPLPDMNKGDFKEVQKGVETRLDATNSLLGESNAIGKAIGDGIGDLNAKSLAANGILSAIRTNTGATAGNTKDIKDALTGDALEIEPDTAESILSGLGLTGDEKFSDLEKGVISLDSYRSQFTWSAGSSSCPPDRSMSLLGSSFLIDWQPYCDAFSVLGYFVRAAAFLIAGFIAFGVRK